MTSRGVELGIFQSRAKAHRVLLEELVGPALVVLRDIVLDRKAPPAVRLRAAQDILDRCGIAEPSRVEVVTIDAIDREIRRLELELALGE